MFVLFTGDGQKHNQVIAFHDESSARTLRDNLHNDNIVLSSRHPFNVAAPVFRDLNDFENHEPAYKETLLERFRI